MGVAVFTGQERPVLPAAQPDRPVQRGALFILDTPALPVLLRQQDRRQVDDRRQLHPGRAAAGRAGPDYRVARGWRHARKLQRDRWGLGYILAIAFFSGCQRCPCQVIPTPWHVLGRISPIFSPFFPVFCAFSPSRRGGSNELQAGTQGQETAARAPKHRFSGLANSACCGTSSGRSGSGRSSRAHGSKPSPPRRCSQATCSSMGLAPA